MLLQLPPRDVLLTQRVCRRWKEVVESSIQLQQALWFRPLASTSQVHFEAGPDHWASAQEPERRKLVFESPLLSSSMDDQPRLRGSGCMYIEGQKATPRLSEICLPFALSF